MERKTLSLKRPDPQTRPKVDPAKVVLADQLGLRFIDRGGRYIAQKLVVTYETAEEARESHHMSANYYPPGSMPEKSRTWIDVPLVPESYCGV